MWNTGGQNLETESKYGRRSQNMGDGAKICETEPKYGRQNPTCGSQGLNQRGKGTNLEEKRSQSILDRGQNTGDIAKQLFTVAKI